MISPKALSRFVNKDRPEGRGEENEPLPENAMPMASLPSPSDVLYEPPNAAGEPKRCGNCMLFAADEQRCDIFAGDQEITENQVCGYHVDTPLTPELAGLIDTENGTCCEQCKFFDDGKCHGVMSEGEPATVDPLGCCSRWDGGAS